MSCVKVISRSGNQEQQLDHYMDEYSQHLLGLGKVQLPLLALEDFAFFTQQITNRVLEEVRRSSESFQATLAGLDQTLDALAEDMRARSAPGTIEGDFFLLHQPQDRHYSGAIERTAARYSKRWKLQGPYMGHALARQVRDQHMSRSRLKRQLLTSALVLAVGDGKRDQLSRFWARTIPPQVAKRDVAVDLAWRRYMRWLAVHTIHLAEQDLLAMMPASFILDAKRARENGRKLTIHETGRKPKTRRQVRHIEPLDLLAEDELERATASTQDEPLRYCLEREQRQLKAQSAHERFTTLLRTLTPQQQSLLNALVRHNMNQDAAVSELGITSTNARVLMTRIRKSAKRTMQQQSDNTSM